jgi:nucleotide-binding universal stress UspA family protein
MSIFPTKILLATDGSEDAALAVTTAVGFARSTGSELHVLTVGAGYPAYDVRVPEVVKELRKQAEDVLEEQVNKIEQSGGKVAQAHVRLAEGHPGIEHHPSDDIVRLAEEEGVGLIVVGSRGLGRMRRALMGSVSDSVVRHAHCPVLVARGEPVSFPTKILLATDGSKNAELAAATAADLAKSTGWELHDVYVGHMPSVLYAALVRPPRCHSPKVIKLGHISEVPVPACARNRRARNGARGLSGWHHCLLADTARA